MIASTNLYDLLVTLSLVLPLVIGTIVLIGWIAMLIYYAETKNYEHAHVFKFRLFPRLFPWTEAAKLRKMKIQVELEETKIDLFEVKHTALQKESVFNDLQEHLYQRAIEPPKKEE